MVEDDSAVLGRIFSPFILWRFIVKLTKNYTVRWHETNATREMTPSAILTLMQETTNIHMQQMYPCLEDFRDIKRQAFILSKIFLRFNEPIAAYDDISVSTWTGTESRGFMFWRSFSVQKDGKTVADALSQWALIDLDGGKLLPVNSFENNFEDEPSVDIEMPRRIKFPAERELELAGSKKITYSDIDYNSHMNNTHYPNMLVDFLPTPEKYRVKDMMLSFVLGSLYNEEIKIYRVQDGDKFYFRTVNADGKTCLEAVITTETQQGEIK